MDPLTMGLIAGGGQLFSSIMGGQAQVAQNQIARLQHEEQEFQRKMQNQIENRNIAKANAAKWMTNVKIGQAASKAKGEEEFWLKYNHDNASGQFSRGLQKANGQIQTSMQARNVNINSGTARAILRQTLETAKKGMINKSVNYSNSMVSAERKQQKMLAQRDFGYSDQVKFMPSTLYQVSDSSIMQQALTTGIVSGAMSGALAYGQAEAMQNQTQGLENLADRMGIDPSQYQQGGLLGWISGFGGG
jgi:cellobiose-specific phosphotransferase system component IIA